MRRPAKKSKPTGATAAGETSLRFPIWLWAALLMLGTILAYLPVWHAGFIWDDAFLTDNPLIKASDGLHQFWRTTNAPDYFPMTSTTLWLEWRLWGGHPLGFHLVNVLLHAASSVLLWRILLRLKIPGSWLAAAIFALHPVNVESVAWISERKNTLSFFFFALSLLSYLKFEDTALKRWYGLALGTFVLALLSKTAAAPMPFVLLGIAWWRRRLITRRDAGRILPFFIMAGLLGLVTIWFQYHVAIGRDVVRTDSFWSRLAVAGCAVWFYLGKALWPVNLMFAYPRWNMDATSLLSYAPGLLLAGMFLIFWQCRRRSWGKALLFALGCFVVMLLPVLGFLNIYFMRYSLVADHWQYFAIMAPIALVAAALTAAWKSWGRANWRLGVALGGALLLTLGALTWKQSHIYANVETLWQDTLAKNPGCWLAENNLGVILNQKGQTDEAIAHTQKAIEIKPDYPEAHNNLGDALLQKGQVAGAIVEFQKALAFRPDYAEAHNNLGIVLLNQGRTDAAAGQFQEAIRLDPEIAETHYDLALALVKKGQFDNAIRQFQEALRLQPDYAEAHNNLGGALFKQGQTNEAIHQFEESVRLKPDNAEAHFNLGNALAMKGQTDAAISEYQAVIHLVPDDAEAHYNLGIALAKKGQLDEAIRQFQEALRLRPDYADARGNLAKLLELKGQSNSNLSTP
jgi:tetratricopeptide (TPR) repeat protein